MNNKDFSRKDFLRTAGSVSLFAALGIGFYGCSSSTDATGTPPPTIPDNDDAITITGGGNTITIDLSSNSVANLREQGGWLLITAANTLIVNVDGDMFRSFTSVCTHQGCSTNWQFNNELFECTCHGSRFDTSGSVVRGPANANLAEFTVSVEGDTVTINK
ncbi:MAG: ubiquinol-cytochrome c reductase iron-sulfur subunit [Balneolaceae bacterium]|nr:MAG: ubiquinol-cytochrome c reductase iron-sulfur subunit [Balneolaceae bacterium]